MNSAGAWGQMLLRMPKGARPKGRGQDTGSAGGMMVSVAFVQARHAAAQRSGSRSPSCPAGDAGKRVSMLALQVRPWLDDAQAVARGREAEEYPCRPAAAGRACAQPVFSACSDHLFISRSETLLSMARKPASVLAARPVVQGVADRLGHRALEQHLRPRTRQPVWNAGPGSAPRQVLGASGDVALASPWQPAPTRRAGGSRPAPGAARLGVAAARPRRTCA